MSRSFISIAPENFRGSFITQGINLCDGHAVALNIDWSTYSASTSKPNVKVVVNLQGRGSNRIDESFKIRSMYIDNIGSTVPIYVYFPDTGFTVVAAPFTAIWYPVITKQLVFEVIGLGFLTGSIPTNAIFVTDVLIQPYGDAEIQNVFPQYLGSPTIQRSNQLTPGFGPPALGDQVASGFLSYTVATATIILPAIGDGSFYYITSFSFLINRLAVISSGANTIMRFRFLFQESNGTVLYEFRPCINCVTAAAVTTLINLPLIELTGMNFRLLANDFYQLNFVDVAAEQGAGVPSNPSVSMTYFIAYTNNPK